MTNLFFITSKCRSTLKAIKIGNEVSTLKRGLALTGNYSAIRIDLNSQSRSLLKYDKSELPRTSRCFGIASLRQSSRKANVDENNVLSSPFPDVHGFIGIYFHEFIYKDLDRWPNKTAVICSATGRGYTYAQIRKLSGRLATSLRKSNIRPGETIAVVLPNVPEYIILLLAASEAGLRLSPINPVYTADELRIQVKNSKASVIFTTPSKHAVVAASISDNPMVKLPIIVIEDGTDAVPPGTIKFQDLVRDNIEEFEKTGEKTGVDSEDTFLLPYSSGTSGLPKGVELSHRNIVANLVQLRAKDVSLVEATTETHQDILPLILPLYHIYGLTVCLSLYLSLGCKMVTLPQFSPDNLFKILEENRTALLYVAPPLVQLLANHEKLRNRHMEAVRTVVSGAAPIGKDILAKFKSRIPEHVNVIQGYGLTETSPTITMSASSPVESTGNLVPNTQIRIVGYEAENEGKNLGVDEVGEIFIRGPQVMKGYYNNHQATADCMDGEWFKSGDLASYNENGLLFIHGRLKELIKVQGYQVAPAEIEHLIQTHDKVADAAVIGVTHEKYGEVPKAFVVPKSGAKLEASEIKDYVAERLSKHKQLGHVEFIEKIPKSAAGKILRRELQKL